LRARENPECQRALVAPKPAEPEKPQPPVSIRKPITPDFLISLEDGKKYKSLKRHLRRLGLTPDQYRAKWELPVDYPMIAPNYAAKRSELAKSIGLGHLRRKAAPEAAVITDEKVAAPVEGAKPKRGRPAKSKTIE
jgi:predicted transcriptional regulator